MLASFIFPAANIRNVVLTTTSCSLVFVDGYGCHPEDGRNMYCRMLVHTYQATHCHDPYSHAICYVSLLNVKFPVCKGIYLSAGTVSCIRNPEIRCGEWVYFTPQPFHFLAKITLQSLAGRQSRL
jgi:hypothetical protein